MSNDSKPWQIMENHGKKLQTIANHVKQVLAYKNTLPLKIGHIVVFSSKLDRVYHI